MKIEYLSHSCFFVFANGKTVVFDPFANIGYQLKTIKADFVSVSHEHFDHNHTNSIAGKPISIRGDYSDGSLSFSTYDAPHDDVGGFKRGFSRVTVLSAEGYNVCHMGDVGIFDEKLVEKLKNIDVLLVPVGGNYTINAKIAKRYIDAIKPITAVPMHYKWEKSNIDVATVDEFLFLYDKNDISYANCIFPDKIASKITVINIDRSKLVL